MSRVTDVVVLALYSVVLFIMKSWIQHFASYLPLFNTSVHCDDDSLKKLHESSTENNLTRWHPEANEAWVRVTDDKINFINSKNNIKKVRSTREYYWNTMTNSVIHGLYQEILENDENEEDNHQECVEQTPTINIPSENVKVRFASSNHRRDYWIPILHDESGNVYHWNPYRGDIRTES